MIISIAFIVVIFLYCTTWDRRLDLAQDVLSLTASDSLLLSASSTSVILCLIRKYLEPNEPFVRLLSLFLFIQLQHKLNTFTAIERGVLHQDHLSHTQAVSVSSPYILCLFVSSN